MFNPSVPSRGVVRHACLAVAGLVCATVLAWPGAASAEASRSEAPRLVLPRSGVLHAGDRVDLRWAGDVSEVDELEIMLTIDRPERRTLQISPELDPVRGVFVWRVPELGRASGRFRVRYHLDGHEVEGAPSARIELLSSIAAPVAPALLPEVDGTGVPARGAAGPGTARTGEGEPNEAASLAGRTRHASVSITASIGGDVSIAIAAARSRPRNGPERFPARN